LFNCNTAFASRYAVSQIHARSTPFTRIVPLRFSPAAAGRGLHRLLFLRPFSVKNRGLDGASPLDSSCLQKPRDVF